MGEKSVQKKRFILETARKVFVEKGYKKVTMKDIVEACNISRGGLYLYFESTRQIFLEVMQMENQEADDVFAGNIAEDATVSDILALFLQEQKKEILRTEDTLIQAIYEFYFESRPVKKDNFLKHQFDSLVQVLQQLIEVGVENEEFYCENSMDAARNIMYILEGMRITAQTIGIREEMVDSEIQFILKSLGAGVA